MPFRLTENSFDVDVIYTGNRYTKLWQFTNPITLDYFVIKTHDKTEDFFIFEVHEKQDNGMYKLTHDGTTNQLDVAICIMNGWKFD